MTETAGNRSVMENEEYGEVMETWGTSSVMKDGAGRGAAGCESIIKTKGAGSVMGFKEFSEQ